ncbi:uncharacterized protein Z518_04519 [Rhinocladiella mackenziei CBS 650.93]|uniref:Rhinocladiella mackenziei CBS 650.93 unplaced genomic scaffold supercont1.3, whole genome shotgun sequence n=1 Tax=Rhinocladiella mackenziei CBS 650.93 TaxID=1442369 RepID=A0A0D2H814_9EURO|nr:uncharacterized protein Z518_04519 [Rhinocladiella mackenziei CBS 650.93]KIX06543.1 hypothetical protein Z518_04519 [Rhinocladiella mackenziei CBS 650.93]
MTSPGSGIFSHVRSKLRHSQSNLQLPISAPPPPSTPDWNNIPIEYRPMDRAETRVVQGYYLNQPLPGPPPRPRTTSPTAALDPRMRLNTSTLTNPTPRTHRRRSAQEMYTPWPGLNENESNSGNKSVSVAIAAALPPDHLNPPPPYSRYPPPPNAPETHSRSQPYQPAHVINEYCPSDYANHARNTSARPAQDVPFIRPPDPPTPVSPLNHLDLQYLGMRQSNDNVTVDDLLSHPMLQRPNR